MHYYPLFCGPLRMLPQSTKDLRPCLKTAVLRCCPCLEVQTSANSPKPGPHHNPPLRPQVLAPIRPIK